MCDDPCFSMLIPTRSKSSKAISKGGGRKWFLTCMETYSKKICSPCTPEKTTTSKCITSCDSAWPEVAHRNENRKNNLTIICQRLSKCPRKRAICCIGSKADVCNNSSQNHCTLGISKVAYRGMRHVEDLDVVMCTHWKTIGPSPKTISPQFHTQQSS